MAETFIIGALVLAFALPVYQRLRLEQTRTSRDRFAELGKEMLGSPKYNADQKALITDMLDDVLSWQYMIVAVVCLPLVAAQDLFGLNKESMAFAKSLAWDEKFADFISLHQKNVMAANPVFSFLFRVEMAVILAFFLGGVVAPMVLLQTVAKVTPHVGGSTYCKV